MVFTVLGAVAELERNLIVERVRAGLRHARAKGMRLGRPKKSVDATEVRSRGPLGNHGALLRAGWAFQSGRSLPRLKGNTSRTPHLALRLRWLTTKCD